MLSLRNSIPNDIVIILKQLTSQKSYSGSFKRNFKTFTQLLLLQ